MHTHICRDGWIMLTGYSSLISKLAHSWFLTIRTLQVGTGNRGSQRGWAIASHEAWFTLGRDEGEDLDGGDSTLTLKPVLSTHRIIFCFYIMLSELLISL